MEHRDTGDMHGETWPHLQLKRALKSGIAPAIVGKLCLVIPGQMGKEVCAEHERLVPWATPQILGSVRNKQEACYKYILVSQIPFQLVPTWAYLGWLNMHVPMSTYVDVCTCVRVSPACLLQASTELAV